MNPFDRSDSNHPAGAAAITPLVAVVFFVQPPPDPVNQTKYLSSCNLRPPDASELVG